MARSALLNVMVQAAMKAGRSLSRDFGEVQNLQVSMKGPGDYVSQADRKAEEIVFAELSKARPGYAFLMEERGVVAFMNDRRLRVAGRAKLTDTVIGCGVPHLGRGQHGNFLIELRNVM